jgi:hypothetical protein
LTQEGLRIEYEDFVVQIGPSHAGAIAVRVLASPAGQGEGSVPPWSPAEWPQIRAGLQRAIRHLAAEEDAAVDPRQAGEALFRALLRPGGDTVGAQSRAVGLFVLFGLFVLGRLAAGGGLRAVLTNSLSLRQWRFRPRAAPRTPEGGGMIVLGQWKRTQTRPPAEIDPIPPSPPDLPPAPQGASIREGEPLGVEELLGQDARGVGGRRSTRPR